MVYTRREKVSKQAECLLKINFKETCEITKIFFHRGTVSVLTTVKGTLSCAIMSRFLESSHLLGCGERANEVHAALVEWLEEGIVLGDLDGEALGVEHFIGARRRRRQGRHLWSFSVETKEAKANICVVLEFPAL